ncbi:hypothetical protein KEM54_004978, partial [Ascosphaera aggregata]
MLFARFGVSDRRDPGDPGPASKAAVLLLVVGVAERTGKEPKGEATGEHHFSGIRELLGNERAAGFWGVLLG